ncbi:protein tilB homolog [Stegodyphus dumicola]|uniref:protein tilB homolog n=1 Tax=Stegodyphus dumicola TaxID=202533 RepID=UPI0015AC0EC0|nr:protein tilB homolog [Stegodyphus dumicola]
MKMARITEDLIRKCAEHNECEIFSLEELSLHQRNVIKIEHIDRWCKDLKILYLHSNLISKTENLSHLKKLEYINFTLNNITRVENLEGCESLKKLDFTVNFIGELTSIESLQGNYNLEELYLTGNPCTEFEGYREYVIATLPQLVRLDGEKIKKSERILAMQKYSKVRGEVLEQQKRYLLKVGQNETVLNDFEDGDLVYDTKESDDANKEDNFWKQQTKHTPQSRIEIFKHMQKLSKKSDSYKGTKKPKPPRKLITEDGRVLNVNEPKLDFEFIDDEENNCYKLDLAVYRYLDSALLEADVEPNYVRIKVKGKIFQLLLPQEVHPDQSTSLRSQTTGHLLVTMPKANTVLRKREVTEKNSVVQEEDKEKSEILEVTPPLINYVDKIVRKPEKE